VIRELHYSSETAGQCGPSSGGDFFHAVILQAASVGSSKGPPVGEGFSVPVCGRTADLVAGGLPPPGYDVQVFRNSRQVRGDKSGLQRDGEAVPLGKNTTVRFHRCRNLSSR